MCPSVVKCLPLHCVLVRKRKDWLARNQDNVSKCGEMSTFTLLF